MGLDVIAIGEVVRDLHHIHEGLTIFLKSRNHIAAVNPAGQICQIKYLFFVIRFRIIAQYMNEVYDSRKAVTFIAVSSN